MGWTFTPDEFVHIWRETGLDRQPHPLRILETPQTEAEAEQLRTELDERLPMYGDPDLSPCLRIMARPRSRVVLIGGGHTPQSELRLLASVVGNHAVVAIQEPGVRPDFGGDIRVAIGRTAKLGSRIAKSLPKTPAGRHPARAAAASDIRDDEAVVAPHPAVPLIRKILLKPHTAEGHIRIQSELDRPTPTPATHYTWIDVRGDGRYLLKAGETVHVTPASTEQIAAHLQKRIDA